jgi:ATP-dependent DNA helicase RecQ
MKVVIVAKTRQGSGACIGAITFDGRSLRLLAPEQDVARGHHNLDYAIGDVWDIDYVLPEEIIPPHVESVIVTAKRRQPPIGDLCQFILSHMPPAEGGVDALYGGLLQATRLDAQYIAARTGIPPHSTMFWRPDRPLRQVVDQSVRIRYCYPLDEGGRTLTFVGFQEPADEIPAGTLLRVSLAHWWRPEDKPDDELRCYAQLSGWYDDCRDAPPESMESFATELPATLQFDSPATMDGAAEQLHRVFGFESFRPAQQTVIDHILHKRDTLAVMPTGSGKSLCYQLPALLFPGLTAVVSPLIALMEDQVVGLRELGIPAGYLNSSQSYDEQMQIMQQARNGRLRLLYAAPETLLKPEVMQLLHDARVECLAIDEAHCISEWGHDFRPEYRQLGDARRRLPDAVCLALTATATARVRQDIRDNLGISDAQEVVTSFNRENLFLAAQERRQGWRQLLAFLEGHRGESGLIYCLTKADVDRLAADLRDKGLTAVPYHADLDSETRRAHHRRFTYEEGVIVVATIAFGMGINKSNVRFVVHYGLPKDVESYYQQIGRAGRDGLRADCLLLYSRQDIGNAMYHINKMARDQQVPAQMRLREMTGLAETNRCRRGPLLRYFDEVPEAETCEMCDNCLAEPQESVDLTIPAQMFLSCVLRTKEMFGASYIVDVLRGSRNKRILGNGHDTLSTYNIGRDYSTAQWQALAGQFVEAGLLRRDMTHGGLSVTDDGWAVLRGRPFRGTAPEADVVTTGPQVDRDYDRELFELLRATRTELAAKQGVPPYVIFSDRSLQEMAAFYPQTVEELLQIHGVGEAKLERYGAQMLGVVVGYCRPRGIASKLGATTYRSEPDGDHSVAESRQRQIAEWFTEGQTVAEIAAALRIKAGTVLTYLEKAASDGQRFPEKYIQREIALSDVELARVLATFAELGIDLLRPVFDHLEGAVSYDDLKIARLLHVCSLLQDDALDR